MDFLYFTLVTTSSNWKGIGASQELDLKSSQEGAIEDLIQNLVDILEPFAEATDYLGGSSYSTEIDEDIFDYNDIEDESYQQYANTPNFQDPHTLLATLLDPRTKSLKEELLRDKVEELILNEILHDSSSSTPISTPNSTPKARKTKYKNSVFTKFHKSRPKFMDDEVVEYLKLEEIDWEKSFYLVDT
ncbi:hypothetical protein C1646_777665 [Rhizophagus diaphanus]|nr:hypothetical protein C1646_777665 [Rhizophagus diaphanus] [Rhizophagus sp. MUCL 43196]